MSVTTASPFERAADDFIVAITTPDSGNGESETAIQALATKYAIDYRAVVQRGGSVLAAMLEAAAQGTLRARVRAANKA